MTDTENDPTVTTTDAASSEATAEVETTVIDETTLDASPAAGAEAPEGAADEHAGAGTDGDSVPSTDAGSDEGSHAGSDERTDAGSDESSDSDSDESSDGDSDESSDGDSDDDADDDENPLETEAEIAADYLEELLDIADLDGDIDTYIEGDRAHVSIVSESEVLVGTDGHVLDALQELARLAVMTETGDRSRLMLDVAGYRDRRRTELIGIAGDAVEEVKSTSDSLALAPMNPIERKIVHDAVAAAGLTSASEGEEPRRRVVVLPSS